MPANSINTSAFRAFGHLPKPDRLGDELLLPHLQSGERKMKRRLPAGLYDKIMNDPAHTSYDDLVEAVYCQAMTRLLPSMHTIYAEGINDLNENGTSTRWMSPTEIDAAVTRYEQRAADLTDAINPATDTATNKWRYTLI